jgi:hypothetical protein
MLTVKLTGEAPKAPTASDVRQLDVICNADGTLTITADPDTAARLAGRKAFGDGKATQRLLEYRITEAWYAAACPT